MTPAARIQAVIEILSEVLSQPRPADAITSAYFRNRRFIGSKDRAAINQRLYRIMRHYHRLSWWIGGQKMPVDARGLVIADAALGDEYTATQVMDMFSGGKYAPAEMTKDEKDLVRTLDGHKIEHPKMPLREKLECPAWAFEGLQKALGDRFEAELAAMLTTAPMDIRVNTLKTTREEVLHELEHDDVNAEEGKLSPFSIRVFGRPQLMQHPMFMEGYFEIQDEGSQLIALIADAKPGEQVADFCAGAGGKTLAIGAAMENRGRIVAMDVQGGRLMKAKERFRRAGLHNIETRELTSERDKYVKRHPGAFDLVLIDAPCTGTGTWRRDPDRRWRQLGPPLDELLVLQKNIIESAYRMVKPGGRLVYATCSLLPQENEDQVQAFLAAHSDFALKPAREILDVAGAGDYLKLTPAQQDTDGFFAAVLVRDPKAAIPKASDKEGDAEE